MKSPSNPRPYCVSSYIKNCNYQDGITIVVLMKPMPIRSTMRPDIRALQHQPIPAFHNQRTLSIDETYKLFRSGHEQGQTLITAYHARYFAHELTCRHVADGVDRLSQSLFDARVDLNPHQIEAALFALRNPMQQGVLLADEVGLGKTIEAALVLCQFWAERRRRLLVICPASLRQQWAQELREKFAVPSLIVDATVLRQQRCGDPLCTLQNIIRDQVVIVSYQFAAKLETEFRAIAWDIVVMDEAHKLRNAHRPNNRIGQALRRALAGRKKLLLTATPLQNSLIELYGLSTLLDEHLFGSVESFRSQYMPNMDTRQLAELRGRIAPFTKRTLRRDVLEYVKYTERKTLTQRFHPTDNEQSLYERITAFLQREDSYALPNNQRHLVALVLHKLLASSTYAVSVTLLAIRDRLQRLLESSAVDSDGESLVEQLIDDEDMASDYAPDNDDETATFTPDPAAQNGIDTEAVRAEIAEINAFIEQARNLPVDSKAQSLLKAIELGFDSMASMHAPRKVIIFTESRRTQDYLYRFLNANGHAGKLVMFSGTNNHEDSTRIYQQWVRQNEGSDRVTGSSQVDRRTALIDYFRDVSGRGADIMIATEAAAEGVNLQFCALIINYDLPWNPQRIEQRIGRCHRYGQRYDVVVINFINTRNHADQRVLELLTQKFNLFTGLFGASDEVLGSIENGLDFEKRILHIYTTCRLPQDIDAAFQCLQAEMEDVIHSRIQETQTQLLEHFDEDVHDRLKLRLEEAQARLDKMSRWFWAVTRYALANHAQFDNQQHAFLLNTTPAELKAKAPTGHYQLARGSDPTDMLSYAYRLGHPLGEWSVNTGLKADTPVASVTFDYGQHNARLMVIEQMRGQSGWLQLVHLAVTTCETTEMLLFTGCTDDGQILDQQTCEKLMSVPAAGQPTPINPSAPASLEGNSQRQVQAAVSQVLASNQKLFVEERDKLEKWAKDKLMAAEFQLENTKTRIEQLHRDSRKATTLQEQQVIQKEVIELERHRRKQRQEFFDVEDEIIQKRESMIDALQERLHEVTETGIIFTIRWTII